MRYCRLSHEAVDKMLLGQGFWGCFTQKLREMFLKISDAEVPFCGLA